MFALRILPILFIEGLIFGSIDYSRLCYQMVTIYHASYGISAEGSGLRLILLSNFAWEQQFGLCKIEIAQDIPTLPAPMIAIYKM